MAVCVPDDGSFSYDAVLKALGQGSTLPEPKLMNTSLRICLAGLALRISRDCLFTSAANPIFDLESQAEKKVSVDIGSCWNPGIDFKSGLGICSCSTIIASAQGVL